MMIVWKFNIDLEPDAISKAENKLGLQIPDDLKAFIEKTNGASPDKYCVKIGNSECVYGATLSFNPDEAEADDVFTAVSAVNNKKVLPFGIDPFGNYYCYDLTSHQIVFWDHEEDRFIETKKDLKAFVESFYQAQDN